MKKSLFKKFFHFLNQKITVVYFSLYRNRSVTRMIEIKKIFLVMMTIIIMSSLSAYYLNYQNTLNPKLDGYYKDNQKLGKEITKLEKRITEIKDYQANYNKEIQKIYKLFGNLDGNSVWEKFAQNSDIELIKNTWQLAPNNWWNSQENLMPLEQINQNRIQLLINIQQLKEIDEYVSLIENLSEKIPTGWPLENRIGYKTSGFGNRISPFSEKREFHTGVDIASFKGSRIIATADGVILSADNKGSFGKVVIIRHDFGYRTVYGHNDQNLVKTGKAVKKGDVIALVGNTGRSTGSHLHYEIRIGREYIDPWPYVVSKF